MVDHAAFTVGNINITTLPSGLVRRDQHHVQPLLDLGEQEALATVDPSQGGGISQEDVRLPAQNRDFPSVPRGNRPVNDARSVGRERGSQFCHRIMGKLDRIPGRKQPDVKIPSVRKRCRSLG